MNYISAEKLAKSYGVKPLFHDISFGISHGEKVALVGANGTGKSTLLKVITGKVMPEEGEVTINKEARVGYLLQEPELEEEAIAIDCLFHDSNPIAALVKDYTRIINDPDADPVKMQELLEAMEEQNAWDFEAKVQQVAGKLGVKNLDQPVNSMSGGQKKRLALAQLILSEPDLLILDEPTNHLDIEAIEWLENYLSMDNITLLMVTHDRYFMDNVCNEVFELERGNLYRHKGNYGYFLEKKAEREANLKVEVEKARSLYKKELEWIRRQPKARGTKAKYRIDAFEGIKEKAKTNLKKDELEISVQTKRQGGKILELHNISKSYDDKVLFQDFSHTFKRGERIGIVGKNGAGKSTFLNVLTEQIPADSGNMIKGVTTEFGYFTQEAISLNPENRVIEEVKEIAEVIELGKGNIVTAGKFLELFLFSPEKQFTYIDKLSGGEKKRLQLLKVLIKNPNFLILDEPTNDLDIDTMNVLEDFLEKFNGCLMIVSHDRYFMDRLVDHLFVFEGDGKLRDFYGNYTDYREAIKEEAKIEQKAEKKAKKEMPEAPKPVNAEVRKATFKEKLEYEALEGELADLESQKQELESLLSSGETDVDKLTEWSKNFDEVKNKLEEKELRWLELSEICE